MFHLLPKHMKLSKKHGPTSEQDKQEIIKLF